MAGQPVTRALPPRTWQSTPSYSRPTLTCAHRRTCQHHNGWCHDHRLQHPHHGSLRVTSTLSRIALSRTGHQPLPELKRCQRSLPFYQPKACCSSAHNAEHSQQSFHGLLVQRLRADVSRDVLQRAPLASNNLSLRVFGCHRYLVARWRTHPNTTLCKMDLAAAAVGSHHHPYLCFGPDVVQDLLEHVLDGEASALHVSSVCALIFHVCASPLLSRRSRRSMLPLRPGTRRTCRCQACRRGPEPAVATLPCLSRVSA